MGWSRRRAGIRSAAWKTFTHFPDFFDPGGGAWWLDDHERGLPPVGEPFIRRSVDLGIRTICVHKGLSRREPVLVADGRRPRRAHDPDVNFVVYHSGYESGGFEGPFTPATAEAGVNRLIASLERAGIGPNENVYAELGSTWWNVMRTPTQAAHVLGKLLKHVGQDNVVWGTDCLFYGSPQPQIQAFRAFQISEEFQERYRYPEAHEGAQGEGPRTERARGCTGSSRCRRGATSPGASSRRSARSSAAETSSSDRRRSRLPATCASTTGWRSRRRHRGRATGTSNAD